MSTTSVRSATIPTVVLEPAAQALADSLTAAGGPPLYTLSPTDARAVLDRLQAGDVAMPPAAVESHTIAGGPAGEISITVVRPVGADGSLPAVVYTHGGGWVLGNFATHERLVRDLTAQSGAAFVFVNYTLSPEAHYPMAIEQVYATMRWVAERGAEVGLDGHRLAVAGDSVGGNMTAAVTLMAKERAGPVIRYQALLYPVTNSAFDTSTYDQFADGPWLTREAMRWFWDAYAPEVVRRTESTASPLLASLEQLRGLPPALVITDEADVLRDEGEDYAARLRAAGVPVTLVREPGLVHGFLGAAGVLPPARAAAERTWDALVPLLAA